MTAKRIATPLSALECALELCDFVLLMMINPGFASHGGEEIYRFMPAKIADLKATITRKGLSVEIALDGRLGRDNMKMLSDAGADVFVAGTSSLFAGGASLRDGFASLLEYVDAL